MEGEQQVEQSARHQLRRRASQRHWQVVHRRGHQEQRAEQRVGTASRKAPAEFHRDVLPSALRLVKDLEIAPDTLDVDVEGVNRPNPPARTSRGSKAAMGSWMAAV